MRLVHNDQAFEISFQSVAEIVQAVALMPDGRTIALVADGPRWGIRRDGAVSLSYARREHAAACFRAVTKGALFVGGAS